MADAPPRTTPGPPSSVAAVPARVTAPGGELALLGLLALLWGSSYLLNKIALDTLPPVTLVALRVVVAAAFLLAVMHAAGQRLPRAGTTWHMLLVQSLLNSAAPWLLLAWGQQHVDSALAGVLNSTSPIFVWVFTVLVTRHEALGTRQFAGAALGLSGVALILGLDALRGLGAHLPGQAAIVLSAMLYAGAAIYGTRLGTVPPVATAAGTMLCACTLLVPLSLWLDRPWTLRPSPASLSAALALGLLCTGIALMLYFRLVRTLGSMGVASQSYLRAGVSVLLGVLVLGEAFSTAIAIGLFAVIAGVALIHGGRLAGYRAGGSAAGLPLSNTTRQVPGASSRQIDV